MAKKKALRHYFDLIVKVFVEISEIIRDYRMPISDLQEQERESSNQNWMFVDKWVEHGSER